MGYILGTIGNQLTDITPYLDEIKQAIITENNNDPDSKKGSNGWGIGFYQHGSAFLIKKASPLEVDERVDSVTNKIRSKIFVSHVRQASVGEIKVANTQPFRYGSWLFAHQGTIRQFRRIKPKLTKALYAPLKKKLQGTTDSEHCFILFLSLLKGAGHLKKGEIAVENVLNALTKMIAMLDEWASMSKVQEPSTCNFILANGNYIIGLRKGHPLYVNLTGKPPDNSSSTLEDSVGTTSMNNLIVASIRFGNLSDWKEVPDNSFCLIDSSLSYRKFPIFNSETAQNLSK